MSELADPHVELPDEDAPGEVQGLYQRALEQVRAEFEERTWQMFWQTLVEDKSAADVAADFGVTSAAVRKARSRVLHRLREEMRGLIAWFVRPGPTALRSAREPDLVGGRPNPVRPGSRARRARIDHDHVPARPGSASGPENPVIDCYPPR
jgi:hypothetical protein